MSRLERLLDNPALFYAGRFILVGRQLATRRLLREHLGTTPDEVVLDVCCGIGEFAEAVDGTYVGIDWNDKFIDQARRKYQQSSAKTFQVGNAMRLPFPEKHFDKAMLVNALHHFPDDGAVRLLSEIRRVTRRLVLIIDADGTPKGLLRRLLVAIDRGKFMRSLKDLSSVIGRVFEIEQVVCFEVGLYTEFLFRCPVDATAGQFCHPTSTRPEDRV